MPVFKSILVSGEANNVINALKFRGYNVIPTVKNKNLAEPVAYHPDMQFLFLPNRTYMLKNNKTYIGQVWETKKTPDKLYPDDVLCNAFYINGKLFGNLNYLDKRIINYAQEENIKLIHVNQGYTGCSTCIVDDNSIITADRSVTVACQKEGIEVLQISPGHIRLPGYDYGFIGGCCGLVGNDIIFTGKLENHPDGKKIRSFILGHGRGIDELTNYEPIDVGGLKELD